MAISSIRFSTGLSRRRLIPIAAVAIFLAIASRFVVLFPETDDFYTDEWRTLPPEGIASDARLLIRRVAPASDEFLLTQDWRAGQPELSRVRRSSLPPGSLGHLAVYRYRPRAGELQKVIGAVWDDADTEIIDCRGQGGGSMARVYRLSGQIRVGDKVLSTAGRHVLRVSWSPSRGKAAVLSAAGPKNSTGIMPFFLSSGGYWGNTTTKH